MIDLYVQLILNDIKTIDEIPLEFKQEVIKKLENNFFIKLNNN